MTEKELEEQVARAICLASGCEPDVQATNLILPNAVGGALKIIPPDYIRPAWTYFISQASAAIKRMAELDPTR